MHCEHPLGNPNHYHDIDHDDDDDYQCSSGPDHLDVPSQQQQLGSPPGADHDPTLRSADMPVGPPELTGSDGVPARALPASSPAAAAGGSQELAREAQPLVTAEEKPSSRISTGQPALLERAASRNGWLIDL